MNLLANKEVSLTGLMILGVLVLSLLFRAPFADGSVLTRDQLKFSQQKAEEQQILNQQRQIQSMLLTIDSKMEDHENATKH